MKSDKHVTLTLIILVIVTALGIQLWLQQRSSTTQSPHETVGTNPLFPEDLAPSEVTKIVVTQADAKTVVATAAETDPEIDNDQSAWRIVDEGEGFADGDDADSPTLSQLLILLKEMKVRSIASENKENAGTFGLGANEAHRVQLFVRGKERVDMYIGKTGTGGRTSYATNDDEENIFLMDRGITPLLDRDWHAPQDTQVEPAE